MRKPCENPKKTKKNKFCNEMQHKATQEDFPCVPKATKQWNQNLSKSKEKQKTKANHEKTLRKSKDPPPQQNKAWQLWGSNPRPCGLAPEASALDHLAKLS